MNYMLFKSLSFNVFDNFFIPNTYEVVLFGNKKPPEPIWPERLITLYSFYATP